MKKQTVKRQTAIIGILATFAVPFLLAGCGKHPSQAPAGGYPGGQKAGAVNNANSDPNYASQLQHRSTGGAVNTSGTMGSPGGTQ